MPSPPSRRSPRSSRRPTPPGIRPLPEGAPEPRPVGECLDGMARRLGAPSAQPLGVVFTRWPELVGEAVAANARPRSLANGVLVVAVQDPAWATQLRYLATTLVARLADAAGPGVVTSIEVRVEAPGDR